jgi:transcriptional regulator with XRE-family HTH domain
MELAINRGTAMDTLRVYLRQLRIVRGVTQEDLAIEAGLSLRAYTDWEAGRTRDIKTTAFVQALAYLKAPDDHMRKILSPTMTEEDAMKLVRELDPAHMNEAVTLTNGATEDQRQKAIKIIESFQDPDRAGEWLKLGEMLSDTPGTPKGRAKSRDKT